MKSSYTRIHVLFCVWACLFGFLFTLPGCEDETVQRNYPKIKTIEVTNITGDGATFVAEVTHEGTVPVTEHGFTWALYNPDITHDERVNLGSFNGTGRFEAEISTALKEGLTYVVCAYVKAGEYTVYGEKINFLSLGSGAPEIIDFMPKSAGWGDTVTISGKKFSHLNMTNEILIDECMFAPYYSSDTLLKFVLPPEVIKPLNSVSVRILGNVASSATKLTFIPPTVFGFTPEAGYWGDTITFTGNCLRYFGNQPSDRMILNDNLLCKVVGLNDKYLTFVIPGQLNTVTSPVSLSYRTFRFSFPQSFTLHPSEADSIRPAEGTWGTLVTLYGKFNTITALNRVLFGDKAAVIISSSCDSLVVKVPDNLVDLVSEITYTSGPFTTKPEEKFILKAPEIYDFEPKSGHAGNLITITGRNFKKDITTVEINGKPAYVRSTSENVITCHVPGDVYGECTVSVKVLSQRTVSDIFFNATNHVITGVMPLQVNYGDTVTISGMNFRSGMTLLLNQTPVSPSSISNGTIKFVVPFWMNYDLQSVTVKFVYTQAPYTVTSSVTFEDQIQLNECTITNISPLSGKAGDYIRITGTNIGSPGVTFGSAAAQVTEVTTTGITVIVPGLSTGEHSISITNFGRTYVYPAKYTHSGPWTRIDDLPFLYDYGCVFDFGEDIYVATKEVSPTVRSIYKFIPDTEGFEKIDGTFASKIVNPESCVSNGLGYILGLKEGTSTVGLELFNPDSLTWRSLPDYPGNAKSSICFFADDSLLYAGGGITVTGLRTIIYIDFWKYSLATNRWTRLQNTSPSLYPNHTFLNNKILIAAGYYTMNPTVVAYYPVTNSWSLVTSSPSGRLHNGISNILNGFWYIGLGDDKGIHYSPGVILSTANSNLIYRFDPGTNTWYELSYPVISTRAMVISFTAGGYLYIGGDQNRHHYDFWRYDPELEQ